MKKITVERRSLEHDAICALNLYATRGENMQGIKGVSRLPRWDKLSWNGYKFTRFTIYLSDESLAKVKAYCERYA